MKVFLKDVYTRVQTRSILLRRIKSTKWFADHESSTKSSNNASSFKSGCAVFSPESMLVAPKPQMCTYCIFVICSFAPQVQAWNSH